MKAGLVAAAALLVLAVSAAAAGAEVVKPQVVTPQVVTPEMVKPQAATPTPPAPTPPPAEEAFADTESPAAVPAPSASPTISSPGAPRPLPSGDSPGDPADTRPRPNRPGVYHYLPGGGVCAGYWSSCAPAYWAAQNQLNFEAMLINDLHNWLIEPVANFFDAFDPGPSSPAPDEGGGQSFSPEEECQCSFEEEGEGPLGPGGIRRLEEDPKLEQ